MKSKLIIRGVLTAVLLGMLLAVAVRFLFPQFTDPYPLRSKEEQLMGNIIGIGIWVISLTVGILVIIRNWKKI